MKKSNINNAPIKKVKNDYFTGTVILREISRITKPTEHDIYHVTFKKSARTKLHFHTGAQMLIVTKGHGSLVYYKKTDHGISKFKISKKLFAYILEVFPISPLLASAILKIFLGI